MNWPEFVHLFSHGSLSFQDLLQRVHTKRAIALREAVIHMVSLLNHSDFATTPITLYELLHSICYALDCDREKFQDASAAILLFIELYEKEAVCIIPPFTVRTLYMKECRSCDVMLTVRNAIKIIDFRAPAESSSLIGDLLCERFNCWKPRKEAVAGCTCENCDSSWSVLCIEEVPERLLVQVIGECSLQETIDLPVYLYAEMKTVRFQLSSVVVHGNDHFTHSFERSIQLNFAMTIVFLSAI
jgi:hypothetical protein